MSNPLHIRSHSPSQGSGINSPPPETSHSRSVSNARLASPVPSQRRPLPAHAAEDSASGKHTPLPGASAESPSHTGPRQSALADALNASLGKSPHRIDRAVDSAAPSHDSPAPRSNHGSFSASPAPPSRAGYPSPKPYEDFDIVRRHLVGPVSTSPAANATPDTSGRRTSRLDDRRRSREVSVAPSIDEDEFSSLRLQGGDVTREIYRRTEAENNSKKGKMLRSQSMFMPRTEPEDETLDYQNLRQPGGMRRHHIRQQASSPMPGSRLRDESRPTMPQAQPSFLTANFFEFLSLYGHFAGEAFEDDDEDGDEATSDGSASQYAPGDSSSQTHRRRRGQDTDEETPLLKRRDTKRRRQEAKGAKMGTTGTIFILLKSFVGTGVLFLPRAFLNGGMLFSFLVMLLVSSLSYYCFLLLTTSRLKLKGSFADMGEMTHGPYLRTLINSSLVVSQIGFASAYIVFTSENLQAFVLAVSKCKTNIDIKLIILMQLVIFMPLSLYRNLNNISYVVYIADLFIVLGLVYLYYYDISTLVTQGGISDIALFNPRGWTLFIGTAIFTFEGIGLIVPIQDGMKKPQQLPAILGGVMVLITLVFVSMGALAYAAFGSKTETVIILNMPQDNKFVNGVQFLYSLAILLSTPMQIFPAITIMEKGIFTASGKYSKGIKWRKNLFRFCVVMGSALIAWVGANDLDKFVALVGSFACIPLVYIYPPLIHQKSVATKQWARIVDFGFCFFGVALMGYTTAITIQSWVTGHQENPPRYCDGR